MDSIEIITIELSPHQADFMGWANQHYQQLLGLRNSGVLDKGGSSFTVHLKPCATGLMPEIDKIELLQNFYPNRSLA